MTYHDVRPPIYHEQHPPDEDPAQYPEPLLEAWRASGLSVAVTPRSQMQTRRALGKIVRFQQREGDYGPGGYSPYDKGEWRGYLWDVDPLPDGVIPQSQDARSAIGGCIFRHFDDDDPSDPWWLTRIWLHPYERGKGRLARAWPFFHKRFPDFLVEGPLSAAMRAFLVQHGEFERIKAYFDSWHDGAAPRCAR